MDTNCNALVVAAVLSLYSVTATGTGVQETDPCVMPPPFAQDDSEGFETASKAARDYDPAALHRLGIALWQWTTCERDKSVPESLRNSDEGKELQADSESFSAKIPVNVTALALLSAAAAAGDKSSQSVLWHAYGVLQADGGLTHLSKIGAEKLFQQAYFQDDPDAQYHLGRRYNRWWNKLGSYGPSELEPLAQFWWERAAQRGHVDAQAWLGRTLVGLERFKPAPRVGANKRLVAKGWEWIEQAATQGSPHALFDLGTKLIRPEIDYGEMRVYNYAGADYDSDEAVNDVQRGMDFLREAVAKAEGPEAPWYALDLANLLSWNPAYLSNFNFHRWPTFSRWMLHGPPPVEVMDQFARVRDAIRNAKEALRWYRYAGSHGDIKVLRKLSWSLQGEWERYHPDSGLASLPIYRNPREAARWVRAAALKGDLEAQIELGQLYADGNGVPKDKVSMYAWWSLAATASLDDLPLHERASLEKPLSRIQELLEVDFHLSPPEVAQGQALARELFAHISVNSEPSPTTESARQGTGILFASGTVAVTSHHVVAGCSRVDVVRNDQERSAAVVGVDGGNDLVLLELDRTLRGGDAYLRPRAKVSVGERAVVAGFPFTSGDGFTVTTGNISATRGPAGRTGLFQLTAPIQQGNSGGPVIGDDGAILGVVVSKLDAIAVAAVTGDLPQNVNYAIHGAVLRTFLDLNGVDYRALARLGRRSDAELADEARGFTVLVTCTPDTQPSGTDVAVH